MNLIWCLLGACGMRQERVRHVRLVSGQLPTGDLAAVVTWQRVAARYRARPAGSSTQSTAPSPAPASLER